MKIQTTLRKAPKNARFAATAFGIAVLSACSVGTPASSSADAAPAGDQAVAAKGEDPAASNEAFRKQAIANGLISARKPCDLLTRPDAEAAAGQPLPQNDTNLTLGTCDYNAADFSAGASLSVGSWDAVKNAATSGAHQPLAISGVGDEALNLNGGGSGSMLYVRRGGEGFIVDVHGPKINTLPDHGLAAEKQLALKVLARF